MAETMDERSRRLKSLLSSYYGTGEAADVSDDISEGGFSDGHNSQQGWARGSPMRSPVRSDINSRGFDADRHVAHLIQDSHLEDLLQQHVAWSAEVKILDSDMQMLVYENYNKFISATDTIRRMKDNVAGMEASMEKLLETVTAVQAKSDGVNASLGERRERIEQLNGTRSLLRKVQYIFDLPKRLRKFAKELNYSEAVKAYVGALPILEAYGNSSFRSCKEEAEDVIDGAIRKLQEKVMSDTATSEERSEAAILLQELNEPVEKLMDEYLEARWDRLLSALQQDNTDFIEEFEKMAITFREIFPMGEGRLVEATRELFNEYFPSVRNAFMREGEGGPAASDLIAALKRLSRDVVSMDLLVPEANLPERATQAVETALSEHVILAFTHLRSTVAGTLTPLVKPTNRGGQTGSPGPKPLQAVLEAAHRSLMQGVLHLLSDLSALLDDSVALLRDWRAEFVDLVHSECSSLLLTLNNHFIALADPKSGSESQVSHPLMDTTTPERSHGGSQGPLPGLVLLLARLAQHIEQTAVPKILDVLVRKFYGGVSRGEDLEPAFDPKSICKQLHSTSEFLLQQYVDLQARKLSIMVCKSITTPNWLKHKEPRDVRMVADLLLQEVDAMQDDVEQLLPPGADRSLWYRHAKNPKKESGGGARGKNGVGREGSRGGEVKANSRARSRLLERDVAKLFTQRVQLFTKLEFTQTWAVSFALVACLKSLVESVRLSRYGRSGLQQLQLDLAFLRRPLLSYGALDDAQGIEALVDEVCTAAMERCLDPVPLDPAVIDRIINSKMSRGN